MAAACPPQLEAEGLDESSHVEISAGFVSSPAAGSRTEGSIQLTGFEGSLQTCGKPHEERDRARTGGPWDSPRDSRGGAYGCGFGPTKAAVGGRDPFVGRSKRISARGGCRWRAILVTRRLHSGWSPRCR